MKLEVKENLFAGHPEQFLRQAAGYAHIRCGHTGRDSYVRRLTRDHYPRLHVYINKRGDIAIFDMHLDQKKISYQGSHAHNAEYDGQVVEREIERLKNLLGQQEQSLNHSNQSPVAQSVPRGIGHGQYSHDIKPRPKQSWWRRLFF